MNTTIAISQKVKEQIKEYGNKGETYDDILTRVFEYVRKRQLQEILMDEKNCVTIDEARERLRKEYGKSDNN